MIAANKAMLESTAKVSVLHIRDKELNYFYNSCNRVSTQAALIAGFAYSGMMYLRYVDRDICERTCAEFTYPLTVCMSMGFAMLSLWQATLASMFAPGLALRGPPGSMDMAVDQLVEEYHGAMRLVTTSLALFLMTVLLWCAHSRLGSPPGALRAPRFGPPRPRPRCHQRSPSPAATRPPPSPAGRGPPARCPSPSRARSWR